MVRNFRLPKPTLFVIALSVLQALGTGCAKKADPIPKSRLAPRPCQAVWSGLRVLDVTLPTEDVQKNPLIGLESVRVYYVSLGVARPDSADVLSKGEVILEQHRPDLPSPGKRFPLPLKDVSRPAGWIVVTATRVGGVTGEPSETLPWLDPAY